MAIISISYEEFQRLSDIENKYNAMLKTWKPISEKSLHKMEEKEIKMLELNEQKQAQKVQKALEEESPEESELLSKKGFQKLYFF